MANPIKSFLLVVKENNLEARKVAGDIQNWLLSRSFSVVMEDAFAARETLRKSASNCDAILVLGGDGTMLGVARRLLGIDIPMLGVNFGRVGFLTEVAPADWQKAIEDLLNGVYQIQRYTAISWKHSRAGVLLESGYAINDVVVARGLAARSISLSLSINDIFLSHLLCDGVILSAPLGATGYAASARGPLAFPSLDAFIVTPISPFAGAFPPLVLPESSAVCLQAQESRGDIYITVDGQDAYPMEAGDLLTVTGAEYTVPMLVRDPNWYWQRISQRGFIMPGPGKYTR